MLQRSFRTISKFPKLIYILIITTLVSLIYYSNLSNIFVANSQEDTFFREQINTSNFDWPKSETPQPCDKWIVALTTNEPTQYLKNFHDAIYGWCVLVVADLSTPKNWTYKDVNFLDINAQNELATRFELIKSVPFNSYRRKIIGYLYAIEHGAKYIFDTDDDVYLDEGLFRFKFNQLNGIVNNKNSIYVDLKGQHTYYMNQTQASFRLYSSPPVPTIQQGLFMEVKGEYDLNSPPLILDTNQYCHLNSKNTFYHYNAFWSLMFPLEVENRYYADMRSYLSIRLMRELGDRVAVIPTNMLTIDLGVGRRSRMDLIKVLNEWECEVVEFSDCILTCVEHLVKKKFLNQSEANFYQQWVQTLNTIGYKWPKMKTIEKKSDDVIIYFKQRFNEQSDELEVNKLQEDGIKKNCDNISKIPSSIAKIDDIILITFASTVDDLDFISTHLGVHFVYTIICYEADDIKNLVDKAYGLFSTAIIPIINKNNVSISSNVSKYERCLNRAYNMGYKLNSFLIIMNARKFEYWNYDYAKTIFNKTDYELNLDKYFKREKDVYFVRRNVANSIRLLKFKKYSNEIFYKTLCNYYESETKTKQPLLTGFRESFASLNYHENDLVGEQCHNMEAKNIMIPDSDDGIRVDVTSILAHLGQQAILANPKKTASAYPDAIRLGQISYSLSQYLQDYDISNRNRSLEILYRENFVYYQNRSEFRRVDAILCSQPVALCEGFMALNKTLILNPLRRYNLGRCSLISWRKLNQNYFALLNRSKAIISSVGKYAEEYQAHFTGLRGYRLWAYGGFYAKNVKYNPIRSEILIGPNRLSPLGKRWLKDLKKFYLNYNWNKNAKTEPNKFFRIREIYSFYQIQDLANHRAIVVFPTASMSPYSIIEYYIANIPIFVPSLEAIMKYSDIKDEKACEYGNQEIRPDPYSIHNYNPYDSSVNARKYWLKYADFYQLPFITVFDSWQDLIDKLDHIESSVISENMKWFNKLREADLLNNWCSVLKELKNSSFSVMPSSYNESLKYFDLNRFHL